MVINGVKLLKLKLQDTSRIRCLLRDIRQIQNPTNSLNVRAKNIDRP